MIKTTCPTCEWETEHREHGESPADHPLLYRPWPLVCGKCGRALVIEGNTSAEVMAYFRKALECDDLMRPVRSPWPAIWGVGGLLIVGALVFWGHAVMRMFR